MWAALLLGGTQATPRVMPKRDATCTVVVAATITVSASDFTVSSDDKGNFYFTSADFNAGFLHPSNQPAAMIKINSLPLSTYGTLVLQKYRGAEGRCNSALGSISALRFETKSSLAGGVSFTYTASADSLTYSNVANGHHGCLRHFFQVYRSVRYRSKDRDGHHGCRYAGIARMQSAPD